MSVEYEGWADVARAVGRALGSSVSRTTARRYACSNWPTPDEPHPLPVGQRGNGVRFLRAADLPAWAEWFKGQPGVRVRKFGGDKRRSVSGARS